MSEETKERIGRWMMESKAGVRMGAIYDALMWPFALAYFMVAEAVKEGARLAPEIPDIYRRLWSVWFPSPISDVKPEGGL